ncbi:hypothetical protein R1flu_029104 [Riccia fluitans]|uniref:Transglycosylase SLT domain-containing protein n=1 Tax=Riccia fluitans TaxID=41844 RepID=A0ABD1XRG1_9MARC
MRGRGGPLRGSWAGAMGQCQFMPSSFQADAVEYDRDGGIGRISPEELWRSLLPGCLSYAVTHGQTVAGHFSEQQLIFLETDYDFVHAVRFDHKVKRKIQLTKRDSYNVKNKVGHATTCALDKESQECTKAGHR